MNKKPKLRRKCYLIKRSFQLRFILTFITLVLIGAIISGGLLYYLSQDTITATFEKSHLSLANTSKMLLPAVIYTNVTVFILIGAVTAIVVLFISHKIAGPLYRFEKSLGEIGEGDFTIQLNIRKKDQLKDMVESINKMSANIRQRIEVICDYGTQIQEKEIQLKNVLEETDIKNERLHQVILDIESKTKDMNDAIAYFKIK